jgi:hypothetical protein
MFSHCQLQKLSRQCSTNVIFFFFLSSSFFFLLLKQDESTCLGIKLAPNSATEIKFSDIYAVEFISYGLVHESNLPSSGRCLVHNDYEVVLITILYYVLYVYIWQ